VAGWCCKLHGNEPQRREHSREVNIFGRTFKDADGATPVKIHVVVMCTPGSEMTEWIAIVEAAEALNANDFMGAILPSNVAVEYPLGRLCSNALANFASRENVDNFLSNGATYSHQLNIVLPLLARLSGLPKLPDEVRGKLNEIRKLRNNIAHRGSAQLQLDRDATSEMFCAAVYGLHYVRHMGPKILSAVNPQDEQEP